MGMPYTSDFFYHFVGHSHPENDAANFDVLLKVLSSGCISHPPHEPGWGTVSYKTSWPASLLDEKLIVPTITCYADIPQESLGIHVKKYGKFGISFPRAFPIKHGARPVMYIPLRLGSELDALTGKNLLETLDAAHSGYQQHLFAKILDADSTFGEPETKAIKAICHAFERDFLAFIKPFDSELSGPDNDNYYMEREWRKYGNLPFAPDQAQNIIVAPGYLPQLEDAFPLYKGKVIEL